MIRALERFQERHGLKVDGYADPGGPTERAIHNRLLAKPRGAGTPAYYCFDNWWRDEGL